MNARCPTADAARSCFRQASRRPFRPASTRCIRTERINNAPSISSLRVQAGLRLAPYFVLLAGAGVNVAVATDGRDLDLGRGVPQSVEHSGATTVRIYPGLLLGLQI